MKTTQESLLATGRRILGCWRGALALQLRAGLYALAYGGLLPAGLRERLVRQFWDGQAAAIHARCGSARGDYAVLGEILGRYRPALLLNAGCGTGRPFPLYQQCGVQRVVGADIWEVALEMARSAFPDADLRRVSLMDLAFPDDSFDFCVCNRVLQHVPPLDIREVIYKPARSTRRVYVNKLTDSDGLDETFFMREYDYRALLAEVGFECVQSGLVGRQTYCVFARGGLAVPEPMENT